MNKLHTNFWVVTKPTRLSVMEDICFESNFAGMELQYAGGLKYEDIYGIYDTEIEAVKSADTLLARRTVSNQ